MDTRFTSQKYDSELSNEQKKLEQLLAQSSIEKKELKRISDKLQVAKVNSKNLSKTNQPLDSGVKSRKKRALYKLEEIKKDKKLQQAKIKQLNYTILGTRKKIRKLELEKKEYLRARKSFEKGWADAIKTYKPDLEMIDLHHYDTLGVHIRATRAMLNMTKSNFANMLDITSKQLIDLERPKKNVELDKKYIKSIYRKLELIGVQIIDHGLHISTGGPGVRLKYDKEKIEAKKYKAQAEAVSDDVKKYRRKKTKEKRPVKVA
jgi:DNA-binding XRE family transcriptional regulator